MASPNSAGVSVPLYGKDDHYWILGCGLLLAALTIYEYTSYSLTGSYVIFNISTRSAAAIFFILAGLFQKRTVHIDSDGISQGGALINKHRTKKIPKDQIVAIDELFEKFLVFYQERPGQWNRQLHIPKKKLPPEVLDALRQALRPLAPPGAPPTSMD